MSSEVGLFVKYIRGLEDRLSALEAGFTKAKKDIVKLEDENRFIKSSPNFDYSKQEENRICPISAR